MLSILCERACSTPSPPRFCIETCSRDLLSFTLESLLHMHTPTKSLGRNWGARSLESSCYSPLITRVQPLIYWALCFCCFLRQKKSIRLLCQCCAVASSYFADKCHTLLPRCPSAWKRFACVIDVQLQGKLIIKLIICYPMLLLRIVSWYVCPFCYQNWTPRDWRKPRVYKGSFRFVESQVGNFSIFLIFSFNIMWTVGTSN